MSDLSSISELDRRLSRGLHDRFGRKVPRLLFQLLEHSGDGRLWLIATWTALLLPATPSATRHLLANFFLGLLVDLAIVGGLKAAIRRPRPAYNRPEDFALVVAVDQYSFPSGHAARVAYVAAFALISASRDAPAFVLLVSAWAFATSLSRALMGRHYLGDVLTGLLLGLVTTAVVTKGTYKPSHGWISPQHAELAYVKLQALL